MISTHVRTKALTLEVVPALAALVGSVGQQVKAHGSLARSTSTACLSGGLYWLFVQLF